jgi:hypothetical protein
MSTFEPSDPRDFRPINRLRTSSSFDELAQKTAIRHLLSDEEAGRAEGDQKEIDSLADAINRQSTIQLLYPMFYDQAREEMESGATHEEIRFVVAALARISGSMLRPSGRPARTRWPVGLQSIDFEPSGSLRVCSESPAGA